MTIEEGVCLDSGGLSPQSRSAWCHIGEHDGWYRTAREEGVDGGFVETDRPRVGLGEGEEVGFVGH